MKFLKKNFCTILTLALVLFVSLTVDAEAAGGGASVMGHAKSKAVNVFKAVKAIVFVVGGFGLVALAFQAIFGKVKWQWFASLAVGLAILAAAGAIVDYSTGSVTTSDELKDSFKDGVGY
jgi:hypothetical protein